MHRSLLPLSAVLTITAACTDSDPADAPPTQGTWRIARTLAVDPAGCFQLRPSAIDVTIAPGAATPIVIADYVGPLREGLANDENVAFVTEELAFPSQAGRPIVIQHFLHLDGNQLLGTGTAQGDAEDLGCTYQLDLVGTRR